MRNLADFYFGTEDGSFVVVRELRRGKIGLFFTEIVKIVGLSRTTGDYGQHQSRDGRKHEVSDHLFHKFTLNKRVS